MILTSLLVAHVFRAAAFDPVASWSAVSGAIRSRYYARVTMKEKMDRLLATYEPKARSAPSLERFEGIVNDMIHDFGDSHFALLTKADQGYYLMDGLLSSFGGGEAMAMPQFGAWFKTTTDGYTVQMVIDGTAAAKADIRKGDVILKVNDLPFSPVDSLATLAGTATLNVKRGSQSLTKHVEVNKTPALDMFLQGSNDSAKVIDADGKKFAYFHLWTQAGTKFVNALSNAVYGRLGKSDAFILDLRDGFGGRPEGYADPFFRPEVALDWITSAGTQHQMFGYGKPLVVLINKGSRSAKEVLSFILKKSKRATLIGSNTAGDVLGTSPLKLGDWGFLEIPMVDLTADGQRLEKVGVAPDIAVPTEFDANGKDLVLDAALKFLGSNPATKGGN